MAQHSDPTHVVVPVIDNVKHEYHSQQKIHGLIHESPERVAGKETSSSCSSEPTRQQHNDLSNMNKDFESKKSEEVTGYISYSNVQRNSKLSSRRLKSRLEDPKWDYKRNRLCKGSNSEQDWFLDEDVMEADRQLKMSSLTIFQLASLLLVMVMLVCTLSFDKLKNRKLWDLRVWKWMILVSVTISGHLVSGWGVRIVVFFAERALLTKVRVLYFVYGMRKAVQHCIWLGLIVTVWHYLVAEKMEKETRSKVLHFTSKILLCLLVGSLVWLGKVVLVKVLASSFHDKNFFERVKIYLFKQYMIKKLSSPPKQQESARMVEMSGRAGLQVRQFLGAFYKSQNLVSSNERHHKQAKRRDSALTLKKMITLVQSGFHSALSTLDEDLPDSSDDEDEKSLHSDAQKVAKKIFQNVAKGSESIFLDDLKRYLRDDKAEMAIHLLQGTAEMGGVREESFVNWTIDAFKERRSLLSSLNDTKTAVDELHHLMNVIVAIIIIIIWLIIFELAITHFLVFISSQLLLVVFIFGNTCRTVFEAIIFLFIMHPFDVGDRCEVDGVQMVVEEMNILTTAFERYDGQKVIYPNTVLATKHIGNYNRSTDMFDQIQFSIHISTPGDKIAEMKERIKRYTESNDKHWYREPVIIVKDVEDMNRLIMVVWPRHKMNHQDMPQRWVRRALLIDEMVRIFRELEIEYRMLPLDLNVRNMPETRSTTRASNWTTCYG